MATEEDVLPPLSYKPVLRLHIDDLCHPAISSFTGLIDCRRLLPNAIKHILTHLYTPYGSDNVPQVRVVTVKLRQMGGVAYTTGLEIDLMHKEIHINLDYLARICDQPLLFRDETIGVITHEMVHCFQHNCKGTAPGGLIEGMADYVRLKAGLAPPHWKKTREELGKKWDEGYQKTAWFLEWLEDKRGAGTVSRMNETMGRCQYKEDEFWPEIFGEKVTTLWDRYIKEWEDKEANHNLSSEAVESPAGTEPEIVDLTLDEKQEAKEDEEIQKQGRKFHA